MAMFVRIAWANLYLGRVFFIAAIVIALLLQVLRELCFRCIVLCGHIARWLICILRCRTLHDRSLFKGGFHRGKFWLSRTLLILIPELEKAGVNMHSLSVDLSPEKDINSILSAWEKIGAKILLKIVGDGSLADQVDEASNRISGVEWLGPKSREDVLELMKDSFALIFPSICYEGLPMTIIEAYSLGLPVIASNLGSMSFLIDHRRNGLHFQPGDPDDLAKQVDWIISHSEELERMRQAARAEYETKYTAELNYKMLIDIYETAIERSRERLTVQIR